MDQNNACMELFLSPDLIQHVYGFWYNMQENTRNTESDPLWGWFWVWAKTSMGSKLCITLTLKMWFFDCYSVLYSVIAYPPLPPLSYPPLQIPTHSPLFPQCQLLPRVPCSTLLHTGSTGSGLSSRERCVPPRHQTRELRARRTL